MLPGEYVLKEESEHSFMESIFDADMKSIDKPNGYSLIARYTSTNRILSLYMVKDERQVEQEQMRASLDVRLEITAVIKAFAVLETKIFTHL